MAKLDKQEVVYRPSPCTIAVLLLAFMSCLPVDAGKPTAMFVFGDSLVDAGNNNHFTSLAKANYSPYGIDRTDHAATGRFCNGRIVPDIISETMGIKYPLPVLDPAAIGENILRGINYASAGAGILEDTGSIFHADVLVETKCGSWKQTAYVMGMRRITVSNIGPIGCAPSELATGSLDGTCIDKVQKLAQGFNAALKPMTEQMQKDLPGSTIVYVNAYNVVMDIIEHPAQYGFTTVNTACCGAGRFLGLIDCESFTSYCKDTDSHIFWDPFHPTEKVNILAAKRFLDGGLDVISPVNVRQVLAMA